MRGIVIIGVLAGALIGGAGTVAGCSSTSSGGGGAAGAAGGGGFSTGGGYGTGGSSFGGSGGTSFGGSSFGGSSFGGSSFGGSSFGGSSFGGGGSGGSSFGGGGSGGSSFGGGGSGGGTVTLPPGCVTSSAVAVQCNPVTNAPCNTAGGEACDLGQDSSGNAGLACFPPPNTQKLGQTCSNGQTGPFCEGKLHCDEDPDAGTGTCKQWCCAASDCPSGKTCKPIDAQIGSLGVCN